MKQTTHDNSDRLHYAWVILAACCLMQSAILGVVQNARGVFYHAVCSDLGLETSAFTLYSLFHGIGSFLSMPFAVRFFNKVHPRLSLIAAAVIFCGSTALMGAASSLAVFWTLGFLQGVGGSLLVFFVCPLLISNWFLKHYGMAMGLSAAFSGLAGVVVNPLLSSVIESAGWRTGYLVQGLMAFGLALLSALLIRARQPEDIGLRRLGEERIEEGAPEVKMPAEAGQPAHRGRRVFFLIMTFAFLASVVNAYCQHFAKYAATLGLAPAVGAALVSCSMVGNIAGKFGIGALNDRVGTVKALLLAMLALAAGFAGMILGAGSAVLYPAAVLSGICMPLCSLCIPMLAKYLYSAEDYRRIYPKVTMMITVASSAGITIVSLLYEIWYSYRPVFLLGILFIAVCAACTAASDRAVRRAE